MADNDRTASLMTPSKLAQVKPRGPVSPAAWLDQMAADAGHQHVRRLAELRKDLQAQAQRRDISPLILELERLGEALPRLDFGLLQPRGWWARATGKGRTAGVEFAGQYEQIAQVAQGLAAQAQAVQKSQQDKPADRALLELEVEFRAIDKIIDQGTRWLHDMRNQIKEREAAGPDEPGQQQIRDDAARCEILVARLKALRTVSSAAQQAHQQGQGAAARQASLAKLMQQLSADVKAWRADISALASAAGNAAGTALNLDDSMESHRELQLRIKQAIADCAQLQAQEKVVAESLDALGAQLEG
jgi:chromosome segregation ATPase